MDPSSYIEGVLLGEQAVECVPENLASALLDEHLDINLIKKFFDADGWEAVIRAHEARSNNHGGVKYVEVTCMMLAHLLAVTVVSTGVTGTVLD